MQQYLDLLRKVLNDGSIKLAARPGLPETIELFGASMEFDLQQGFPILTTKQMPFKTITKELLWILSGDTNVRTLITQGVEIWTKYAYKYYLTLNNNSPFCLPYAEWYIGVKERKPGCTGELGNVYGHQWRNFGGDARHKGVDQVAQVIRSIQTNPNSRYHIISAWSPEDFIEHPAFAALPSCPAFMQFNVRGHYLDLSLLQRSCDMFLGVPFDITEYALLLHIMSALTGYLPGKLYWTGNSVHIYTNHLDQVVEQLKREPLTLPNLVHKNILGVEQIHYTDFGLGNYQSHGKLSGELAVGV